MNAHRPVQGIGEAIRALEVELLQQARMNRLPMPMPDASPSAYGQDPLSEKPKIAVGDVSSSRSE